MVLCRCDDRRPVLAAGYFVGFIGKGMGGGGLGVAWASDHSCGDGVVCCFVDEDE